MHSLLYRQYVRQRGLALHMIRTVVHPVQFFRSRLFVYVASKPPPSYGIYCHFSAYSALKYCKTEHPIPPLTATKALPSFLGCRMNYSGVSTSPLPYGSDDISQRVLRTGYVSWTSSAPLRIYMPPSRHGHYCPSASSLFLSSGLAVAV